MLWDGVGVGAVGWDGAAGGKSWDTSYTAETHIDHN